MRNAPPNSSANATKGTPGPERNGRYRYSRGQDERADHGEAEVESRKPAVVYDGGAQAAVASGDAAATPARPGQRKGNGAAGGRAGDAEELHGAADDGAQSAPP